jgi:hypothetical protein
MNEISYKLFKFLFAEEDISDDFVVPNAEDTIKIMDKECLVDKKCIYLYEGSKAKKNEQSVEYSISDLAFMKTQKLDGKIFTFD